MVVYLQQNYDFTIQPIFYYSTKYFTIQCQRKYYGSTKILLFNQNFAIQRNILLFNEIFYYLVPTKILWFNQIFYSTKILLSNEIKCQRKNICSTKKFSSAWKKINKTQNTVFFRSVYYTLGGPRFTCFQEFVVVLSRGVTPQLSTSPHQNAGDLLAGKLFPDNLTFQNQKIEKSGKSFTKFDFIRIFFGKSGNFSSRFSKIKKFCLSVFPKPDFFFRKSENLLKCEREKVLQMQETSWKCGSLPCNVGELTAVKYRFSKNCKTQIF